MNLNDPAVRIAAVTGEDPDGILWQFVRLIEAGYDTLDCAVMADRAVEAGMTIAEMVTRVLGPEGGSDG